MKNIVLMGAPGSGKGTQGEMLKMELNLTKIALGDILRDYRSDKSNPFSSRINETMDSGKLLPSDLVNEIAKDYILQNASKSNGFLLDGYPRKIDQAEFVDSIFQNDLQSEIQIAIMLEVSLNDLVDRLKYRQTCKKCGATYNTETLPTKINGVCDHCGSSEFSTRKDDSEEQIIKTRFEEFTLSTMPVVEYYQSRGKLVKINANQAVENVYREIIDLIKSL
jgi:adenylate kinase